MASKRKREHPPRVYGKQRKGHHQSPSLWLSLDAPDGKMSWIPSKPSFKRDPLVPKQPPSQKAATMPSEPDATEVKTLMELTGVDARLAIRYLKVKQNNLEAAVNAVFEGEDIEKLELATTWDDSAFTADRDGNDTTLRPLGASPAPTRGPSPAPSLGLQNPRTRIDEERELEAALAASRGGSAPFQQETGVLRPDGTSQQFGPATREYYDNEQWALVPSLAVAHAIVPDVEPVHRGIVPGEPRFLKHLPDGDYLPNLLTICHAIPKAREALLMCHKTMPDYGYDADWWRGNPIHMPRIVHLVDGTPSDAEGDRVNELIAETQRLIAFLECSDRSYGAVGGLTQTNAIHSSNPMDTRSGTLLELFLNHWSTAAAATESESTERRADVFTTTVGTSSPEGTRSSNLTLVDLKAAVAEGEKMDLLEVLDDFLWEAENDEGGSTENYIERAADIVAMRVTHAKSSATQLGIEAPSSIYLDKYLRQNIALTRSVRQRIAQGRKRVAKIESIERRLQEWQHPQKSARLDARQLLQHTLAHFSGTKRRDTDPTSGSMESAKSDQVPPHYPEIAAKLESIIASIDRKLEVLSEDKEKTRRAISEMSKSGPPELKGSDLQHHYTLRGVATKPNITYLLQAKDDAGDEEMLLQPEDDGTPAGWQWWRIEYEVTGSTAHVTKTRAPDYDVLRAVELEHNSALLVYASDAATSKDYCLQGIPQPLWDFCTRDSRSFAQELHAENVRPPAYSFDEPRPSIERNSMDSTRAEGGDSFSEEASPPQYGDEAFDNHPSFGLGYGVKTGHRLDKDDTSVAEINLTPEADLMDVSNTNEVEMMEKKHEPLIPGFAEGGGSMTNGVESSMGEVFPVDKSDVE